MYTPCCDDHIQLEDYEDTDPFECPLCGEIIQLEIDEGSYRGAAQKNLINYEEN